MKYILFMIIVANGNTSVSTAEFNSLSACESAGARLIDEIRGTPNYSIGKDGGSHTYCLEKG